jgi:hypothetical protein
MMRDNWRQKPLPELAPVEPGMMFAPGYGDAQDGRRAVRTAAWAHVCACRFGPARTSTPINCPWSGDSYRHDIFQREGQYALRWWNGGGTGWLLDEDQSRRAEASLLPVIAGVPDEPRRWDYCHFLWATATLQRAAGASEIARAYAQAFVEKRLKVRRRRGRRTVEILPAAADGNKEIADANF